MNKNILTPKHDQNGIFLRQIRSFVCRKGRMTSSQLNSIKKYWSLIGIDFQSKKIDFLSIFNSDAPVVLEIGFGSGVSLVKDAINFPDKNFLGVEVYTSGIGSCLYAAHSSKIKNLRIIYYDAYEVMNSMIFDQTLSAIQIFFPDPWHKKRHHKRRLLQKKFLKIIAKKLIISGVLHIATDSKEYAYYILNEIKDIKNYINASKHNNFIERPIFREITKFEEKGFSKGHNIFDLMFYKKL